MDELRHPYALRQNQNPFFGLLWYKKPLDRQLGMSNLREDLDLGSTFLILEFS